MENPHPNTPHATVVENGAFTIAAVQADEDTMGMEAEFEQVNLALLAALRQLEDLELECQKAEGKLAQADHGKKGVDKAIGIFELALLSLVGKRREDPRYQRYFKDGLVDITRSNMRTVQPGKVETLIKKMAQDQTAPDTDAELKVLLVEHAPRIQAGASNVAGAAAALSVVENQRNAMKDVTLEGLRQAWISKRQVLYANLRAKFPNDLARVEAYFKPFSKPRKRMKKEEAKTG